MTARRAAAAVAALTAFGALLRVPGLDSGMWFDEIVTLLESIRLPLRQVITAFPGYNNHPLYSLLAHMSVAIFGDHVWAARLPAYAFGVAGIPLLYLVGASLVSRREGLMAALLLSVSYHDVWFSQNARGYTMLLFFTLLATLLFVRLLRAPRTTTAIAYGIAGGLGIYTHLTMGFVVVAHVIVWIWQIGRSRVVHERPRHIRTAWLALGTVGLLTVLLYLPMADQVFTVLSGPRPATAKVATPTWAALEALRGLRIGFGAVGVLLALGLLVAGTISHWRSNPLTVVLFVLPGAITAAVLVVGGGSIRPRFFFSFIGFGLLMLVRGAIECGGMLQRRIGLERRRLDLAATIVMLIAAISAASLRDNYRYPKQDYGGALAFIEQQRAASEPVVTAGLARYPYARYYRMPWTAVETPEEIEPVRGAADRVWVVYSFEEYMDAVLVAHIRKSCTPRQVFHGTLGGGDIVVCTFERKAG